MRARGNVVDRDIDQQEAHDDHHHRRIVNRNQLLWSFDK